MPLVLHRTLVVFEATTYGPVGWAIPPRPFRCKLQGTSRFSVARLDRRSLSGHRLQPWLYFRDRLRAFYGILVRGRAAPLRADTPLMTHPKLIGPNSVPLRLLRFHVPLAASPLESGSPGLTSPDIFRPWPFSDLRRLTPPAAHLFCFTQIPPMGFKEHKQHAASREPALHLREEASN
jgi:hypothetical protein